MFGRRKLDMEVQQLKAEVRYLSLMVRSMKEQVFKLENALAESHGQNNVLLRIVQNLTGPTAAPPLLTQEEKDFLLKEDYNE